MTLCVVPVGLAAASAAVEGLTAGPTVAQASAASITAMVPPAADPVSLHNAVAFSVRGGQHAAVAGQGVEHLGRSGVGVARSNTTYSTGHALAASSYPASRGVL